MIYLTFYLAAISLLGGGLNVGYFGEKLLPKRQMREKTLAGRALPYAKLRL